VETAAVQGVQTYTIVRNAVLDNLIPKTIGDKIGYGALNMVFGLGSYLNRDIPGGLTITAGYAAAIGLFVIEATALDWDSPAVGVPATFGVAAAGLTLVYGFARPFIYNSSPQMLAMTDNTRVTIVPVSDEYSGQNNINIRLTYTFKY
jgi:hypothetical protein